MRKEFIQTLAEYLHKKFCSWNHVDYCFWYYEEKDKNPWDGYAHKDWFKKAEDVINQVDKIKIDFLNRGFR